MKIHLPTMLEALLLIIIGSFFGLVIAYPYFLLDIARGLS